MKHGAAAGGPFVRVWRFAVKPEFDADFRRMNGPDGAWARLFARAAGFLGTTLEAVPGEPHAYLTRDAWRSDEAFRAFLRDHADDYRRLDEAAAAWTTAEILEYEGLSAGEPSEHDRGARGPAARRREETR